VSFAQLSAPARAGVALVLVAAIWLAVWWVL
jgi:hypothetical protein